MLLEKVKIKNTEQVEQSHLAPYSGGEYFLVDNKYLILDIADDPDDVEETILTFGKRNLFIVRGKWE